MASAAAINLTRYALAGDLVITVHDGILMELAYGFRLDGVLRINGGIRL